MRTSLNWLKENAPQVGRRPKMLHGELSVVGATVDRLISFD
jgi:hypothetical protein